MTWEQIKEIEKQSFAVIGHHSHSHDYLIDKNNLEFISDIEKANKLFLDNIGYVPTIFSYPFGEYSEFMRNYISKNFKYAFGQHSGVIDLNKEKFQLPRFPINENYGKLDRFIFSLELIPLNSFVQFIEYEFVIIIKKSEINKNFIKPPIVNIILIILHVNI